MTELGNDAFGGTGDGAEAGDCAVELTLEAHLGRPDAVELLRRACMIATLYPGGGAEETARGMAEHAAADLDLPPSVPKQ